MNHTIEPVKMKLGESFKNDKNHFHEFFLARAKDEIAMQIRNLRKLRDMGPMELARKSGLSPIAVSQIEQGDYGTWPFRTLARIAEALDARVQITFVAREVVVDEYLEKDRAEDEAETE